MVLLWECPYKIDTCLWWEWSYKRWGTVVHHHLHVQLTLAISNSMGQWKRFESNIVWLKRSYGNTGSVVCFTVKGRQLEQYFEVLKPASHVPILGAILNIFDVFVAVFFLSVKFFESCGTTDIFFCVYEYLYLFCLWISAVALSLNFTHHDIFFFVQNCLFTINCVFLLFNKV